VSSFLRLILLCVLPAAALAQGTSISTEKPIVNFRLPAFTPEGNRAWLVRGSEARYAGPNEIGIKELTLSIFAAKSAEEKVDTLILSPLAVVHPADAVITGPEGIRVLSDQFEASGSGWRYAHKDKKVSIAKNVRVAFRAEFKDFLK
jgi:hypothetical protein